MGRSDGTSGPEVGWRSPRGRPWSLGIVVLVWANRQLTKNRQLKTRTGAATGDDVHGAAPLRLARHRTGGAQLRADRRPRHPVRLRQPSDRRRVRGPRARRPTRSRRTRPSQRTPVLGPGQEWRTVWDSAISREELGGSIRDRFDGIADVLRPRRGPAPSRRSPRRGTSGRPSRPKFRLDWATLQPVQRIELMTTHDLAKREKQKLELLRSVLTYFHYASKETQPDVFRAEIDRMNKAVRRDAGPLADHGSWTRPPSSTSRGSRTGRLAVIPRNLALSTIGSTTASKGEPMTSTVAYEQTESVATITLDDGKVNVLSPAMQQNINAGARPRREGRRRRRGQGHRAGGQLAGVQRRLRPQRLQLR